MTQPPTSPGDQGGYPNPAQQPPPPIPTQPPPGNFPPPPAQQYPPQPDAGQQYAPPAQQNQQYSQHPDAGQQYSQPAQQNQQYPAPGQPAGPTGSAAGFNPATVAKGDWAVLGIGVLMLIFSFFGWLTADLGPDGSISQGGWHGWWVLIQLILLAIVVVKAVQVFTGNLRKEIPGVALAGAGALLVLLTLIALIQAFNQDFGIGPGFGIWVYFILSFGLTYFLALSAQREGKLPFKVPGPAGF